MPYRTFLEDISKTKILIVEDETLIAKSIEESLLSLGYQVCGKATSGEEAIQKAEDCRPNLILMDIILRGEIDGVEAAQRILENQNIPVVYLTAYADEESVKRSSMSLPYGYITKPFKTKDLDVSIRMAILRHDVENKLKESEQRYRELHEKVRNLTAHLQSIREEERAHIAREVHDELGQALTVLKMDLSWLRNKLPTGQKMLVGKTVDMISLTDRIIQSVKKISSELRPGLLDDLGLVAAIEWQAQNFQEKTGLECLLDMTDEEIDLDQERSTAIFRIFQETLTNIARHADATKIDVRLKMQDDVVVLTVRDNGKGITQKEIDNPKSFGILGIKERAAFFNGNVHFTGVAQQGTTVSVSMPTSDKT